MLETNERDSMNSTTGTKNTNNGTMERIGDGVFKTSFEIDDLGGPYSGIVDRQSRLFAKHAIGSITIHCDGEPLAESFEWEAFGDSVHGEFLWLVRRKDEAGVLKQKGTGEPLFTKRATVNTLIKAFVRSQLAAQMAEKVPPPPQDNASASPSAPVVRRSRKAAGPRLEATHDPLPSAPSTSPPVPPAGEVADGLAKANRTLDSTIPAPASQGETGKSVGTTMPAPSEQQTTPPSLKWKIRVDVRGQLLFTFLDRESGRRNASLAVLLLQLEEKARQLRHDDKKPCRCNEVHTSTPKTPFARDARFDDMTAPSRCYRCPGCGRAWWAYRPGLWIEVEEEGVWEWLLEHLGNPTVRFDSAHFPRDFERMVALLGAMVVS